MKVLQKTKTIVRYQRCDGNAYYGIVEDDEIVQLSSSTLAEVLINDLKLDGERLKYNDVKILEPVVPSKIINFGWTYADHAKETGGKANLKEPFLFLKPTSSVIPDQANIVLPSNDLSKQVEMEGKVALVIGKRCRNVKEEEALDYVFGCTIFNDVTARDLTKTDPLDLCQESGHQNSRKTHCLKRWESGCSSLFKSVDDAADGL
jgi:2-keto-4-pentenoate hydratase/2-oxohepta-3-ene-1,7-dioic acid hydratase in catechol pathway